MRKPNKISLLLATVLALGHGAAAALDLNKPEDSYQAMLRVVGDLSGKPVFKDWDATIFAQLPGEKARPILRTIGFNAGRLIKQPDGSYHWVTREVSFYVDLKTGQIIDSWANPFNGKTVKVVQVANDPVSNKFPVVEPGKPNMFAAFSKFEVRGDVAWMRWDVPLKYPNELKPADYPEESHGDTYIASEHFHFFVNTAEAQADKPTSTATHYSWFRTGPWLPWMKMGQAAGVLLYSGNGRKYDSFEALPEQLREYTRKHYPKFMDAPTSFYQPNETSWSYYRKLREAEAAAAKPAGK
ncbi:MAG: DUF1838 domain-containing protein [Comamonadaceae bacterium]|nr:DUF1838 domain-containing protein [Comamonadaceae bacterium]